MDGAGIYTNEYPHSRMKRDLFLALVSLIGCALSPLLAEDKAAPAEKKPVIEAPVITCTYIPVYPIDLYKRGVEGKVLVEVSLDKHGDVLSSSVIESKEAGFNASACYAAEHFKFKPGRKDGKAAPLKMRMEMAYTLDKAVIESKDVDVAPQFLKKFRPKFPPSSTGWFGDGEELSLSIDFVVDRTGKVTFIYVHHFSNETYANAYVRALKDAALSPALVDGKPVSSIIRWNDISGTGRINWY